MRIWFGKRESTFSGDNAPRLGGKRYERHSRQSAHRFGNATLARLKPLIGKDVEIIVIEELYTTYKNPMTAILMGHARGVLALAGAQRGVPVRTLGHSLVKRALTGSGSARKEQVNAMVTQLLRLQRTPEPNDVSDALALAIAFLNISDHDARIDAALELTRGAS